MTPQSIVIEQPIKASPARVWQRISTPAGIASWWRPGDIARSRAMNSSCRWTAGARFPAA